MHNRRIAALVATAALVVGAGVTAASVVHAEGPPTPGWCKSVAGSSGRVTTVKLTSDGSDSFAMSGNLGRFDSFQVRSPSILFGDAPSAYAAGDTVDVGTLVDPLLANFAYAITAPGFKVKAQRWTTDATGATWESQTNTPASTSGGVGADHRLYEIQICTKAT